jgi:hypothetical protein
MMEDYPIYSQIPNQVAEDFELAMTQPDPAWDYTPVFEQVTDIKTRAEDLINAISDIENATPETDQNVKRCLEEIRDCTENAIALLTPINESN